MENSFETLEQISEGEELIGFYDKEEQDKIIMNTLMALEKEKAYKEGFAEGIAEGKEEGILIAKAKAAKKMLKMNMDINLISKVTKISVDEIKKIQNDLFEEEKKNNEKSI
ncbi:MAG: hypothetical protein RR255_05180 [Bacilli bacterium]